MGRGLGIFGAVVRAWGSGGGACGGVSSGSEVGLWFGVRALVGGWDGGGGLGCF